MATRTTTTRTATASTADAGTAKATTTTRGRRSRLDRSTVVDAAIELADAEGLDAVTVRRLAQELSVTPMALYWHFADKDALLGGIGERVWDDIAAEYDRRCAADPAAVEPLAAMRCILEALIGALRRHPAVASLVPEQVLACPSGLNITEVTLQLLEELGLEAQPAADMAFFVLCSAIMLVTSRMGPDGGDPEWEEIRRHKRVGLASLSPERYPHVVGAADYLVNCADPDAYYALTVELIIDGVRARAAAAGARTPAKGKGAVPRRPVSHS